MRILVPRCIGGVLFLFALLCLMPATSPDVFAKPIPYEPLPDPNEPPAPKGDNDGVVVKAGSIQVDGSAYRITTSGRASTWSLMREYVRLLRWGYGLRWYR